MKPVLSESLMRENRMSGSMSGVVETGPWSSYLGTVRRKGRKQRSQTYHYRATSRLYLWNRRLRIDRSGPFFTGFLTHSWDMRRQICKKMASLGPILAAPKHRWLVFAIDDQSPTGC